MTWKSTAFVSGAGLLATWLASGPPTDVAPGASARVRAAAPATAASAIVMPVADGTVDIVREADRLQARAAERAGFRAPARDLFQFGARPVSHPGQAPPSLAPAQTPVVPALPPVGVRLSGVAADVIDGVEQRTAIFSSVAGVQLAREGEQVDGFLLVTIEADAAVLQRPTGESIRLSLVSR